MMPKILIATQNRWKYQLFSAIITNYGFDVISLKELASSQPPPVENGATVIENALIKARHYQSDACPWVFGDDTGLEIDALQGEPGVQTRRWGGRFPDDVSDQIWLDYLLLRMQAVPPTDRTASFVDGWALVGPQQAEYTHLVRAPFRIATHAVRPPVPGSPLLAVAIDIPEDPAQIFAEAKARWQDWGIMEKLLGENPS